MPSQLNPKDTSKHTAVFPPATNQTCKLESWSDKAIKPTEASPIVEAHVDRVFGFEEQEAERWDGMS